MDISSLVVVVAIAAYVLFEYRRREELHQKDLALLRKGERPPDAIPLDPVWKIITTGGMLMLLLGVTAYMAHLAMGAHPKYAFPLVVMTGIGMILAVVVGLMFFRNLANHRSPVHSRREEPR